MDKTFLEKRIKEIAEEQTKKEYDDFIKFMINNKFARNLMVIVGDNESIPLSNFGCNYGLFNGEALDNKNIEYSNLKKIYNIILEDNINKNTDDLLEKMDNVVYLFEGRKKDGID